MRPCSAETSITEYGDDDDDEVEDVPRLSEVIPAQSDELDEAFEREDGDEDSVDVMKYVGQLLRLIVMLNRHRSHVQQNHQHYADVKLLICRQLEKAQLTFQLQKKYILTTYINVFNHKSQKMDNNHSSCFRLRSDCQLSAGHRYKLSVCVCLCVNQGDTNHNQYT